MTTAAFPSRGAGRPSNAADLDPSDYDAETDIVVVGGGGGGLPSALFARWLGNDVILLEKATELGGTARKAAFWYWVPNNEPMRTTGIDDTEEGFLQYVARLSRPQCYDPAHPTLGMSQWEFDLCKGIYQSASEATELLNARGALVYRHCAAVPDYWSELEEDTTPTGRVLVPADARESMSDGGQVAIRTLSAAAERDGIDCRTAHRVQRVITADGAVVGVEATTADGTTRRIARSQGSDLRDRWIHPRPRAAPELPQRAGVRGVRGDVERRRLRADRSTARRPAAQHAIQLDVPDPPREGRAARP